MTNLEWFIKQADVTTEGYLCAIAHTIKEGHCCNNCCVGCKYKIKKIVLDILLSEYIEQIKLKQWEKDFLETLQCEEVKFCCHELLLEMRYKGHFKGISDIDMNLREILDNCEVIDD